MKRRWVFEKTSCDCIYNYNIDSRRNLLKMKYDEMKYYNEQKERITIYMKHNVKGYKNISFTNFKENQMDGYSISGYINNDKTLSFTAGIRSIDDFQFDTDISYTDELGRKFIKILSQFPK